MRSSRNFLINPKEIKANIGDKSKPPIAGINPRKGLNIGSETLLMKETIG
jgi:hypothetical protein